MRPVEDRAAVEEALTRLYGVPPHALEGLHLYESDGDRVYAAGGDAAGIDGPAAPTRVERVGVYLATWTDFGLRLGMDGAALLADAAEPVVELDEDEAPGWLAGEDLSRPEDCPAPFVVLRWGDMVLGCGLVLGDAIRNRVPKERRIPRDAVVTEG